jgi:hypothetical protein
MEKVIIVPINRDYEGIYSSIINTIRVRRTNNTKEEAMKKEKMTKVSVYREVNTDATISNLVVEINLTSLKENYKFKVNLYQHPLKKLLDIYRLILKVNQLLLDKQCTDKE